MTARTAKPIRLGPTMLERLATAPSDYRDAFAWINTAAAKTAATRLLREIDEIANHLAAERLARLLRQAKSLRLPGADELARAAAEDGDLAPWFRPREVSCAMRRKMTTPAMRRWDVYLRKYGCHRCGKKDALGQLGFCGGCRTTVGERLRKIVKSLEEEER